jgi:lipoprotein-anchoring transpeptidase ErfK/SrfK
MRRVVFGGIGVLVALLLGAGAYAFGGVGGPAGDRPAATSPTGASEPPRTASAEPPAPVASTTSPTASASTAAPAATSSSAPPKPAAPAKPAGCPQGERQRDVEVALAAIGAYGPVTVDGVQSPADCTAITKFQKRYGISPANGRAGSTTADVARRIAASRTPETRAKCRATVCIDLTLQTLWVVRGGEVVFGPTVVRTGYKGYATPTGTYRIGYRNIKEWSRPYKVWMPYWQQFNGGIGLHETTTYIHNGGLGSHGCVNLLRSDARELWNLLGHGTTVHTFGRRVGT